jgi:hypothetical protein
MRRRSAIVGLVGIIAVAVGLWIVLAPFPRPVPGGVVDAIEVTPEARCGSALLDALRGDATATAVVAATEVASSSDPQEEVTVDCSDRARTRVAVGVVVVILGGIAVIWARQSRGHD